MNRFPLNIIAILAVLLYPLQAPSEVDESDSKVFLDWMSEKNFEVRKSFGGTVKDAGVPASFSYFNADDGDDFYAIDLAIRASEFGGWGQGLWQGRYFPIVEHHQKTKEGSRANKTEASLGGEIERSLSSCAIEGSSLEAPFCRSLLIDFRLKLTRDSENDKTTRSASLIFAPFGTSPGWPGSDVTTAKGTSYFYWLPSLGFEAYESLPIERKIDGESVIVAPDIDEAFAVARLNVEYRPFADRLAGRLALVTDYSYYDLLGSSTVVDSNYNNLAMSLDYYLDAKKRVAIGIKYENGESPARNFLDQETTSVGLSLKISPD